MRSTMIIMSLLFAAWVGYEKPETQIVKDYEYTKTEAEMDTAEQENRKWFESDEEWADRRTKSNSTLEVTIERTDHSVFNEEGLLLASIYYDRPVRTFYGYLQGRITFCSSIFPLFVCLCPFYIFLYLHFWIR